MGTLKVTEISTPTDTGSITIPSGVTFAPSGHVIQVKSATKDDTFNTTSSSFTDITGLSVSITPSSTSNKVLVMVNIGTHDFTAAATGAYQIVRGSTAIGVGSTSTAATMGMTINADRGEGHSMTFLDEPNTTAATTYKLQVRSPGSNTLYINERQGSTDYRTISTITVMEVAG
jgi:hypothetical protein